MSGATWKQTTIGWFCEYRGLTCRILIDQDTDKPTEIRWFIYRKLADASPVTCDLDAAKVIACEVVDRQIAEDPAWTAAERLDKIKRFTRR